MEAVSDSFMSKAVEGGARGAHIISHRLGDTTHPILWTARKLRRVARSRSTDESLAATDAVSAITYLKHLLSELKYDQKGHMIVNSRALANLATSIREQAQVKNKIDLAYFLKRFIPHGISRFGWLPDHYKTADGMTKDNGASAALILCTIREGTYPRHTDVVTKNAEHPLMEELPINTDKTRPSAK